MLMSRRGCSSDFNSFLTPNAPPSTPNTSSTTPHVGYTQTPRTNAEPAVNRLRNPHVEPRSITPAVQWRFSQVHPRNASYHHQPRMPGRLAIGVRFSNNNRSEHLHSMTNETCSCEMQNSPTLLIAPVCKYMHLVVVRMHCSLTGEAPLDYICKSSTSQSSDAN